MSLGFVHIVESPSAEDLLNGRTEGRVLSESLALAGIDHCYQLAINRNAFIEAVTTRVVDAYARFNAPPLLHISAHGDGDGLELASGEFIKWEELRGYIGPLREAMSERLVVALSACRSGGGCRMAMNTQLDPPFWALIGHTGKPTWSDAAVAFVAFYHNLFKGHGIPECVAAMKAASGDPQFISFDGAEQRASWIAFQANQLAAIGRALAKVPFLASSAVAGSAAPHPGP
jgi:hypothetical protein